MQTLVMLPLKLVLLSDSRIDIMTVNSRCLYQASYITNFHMILLLLLLLLYPQL